MPNVQAFIRRASSMADKTSWTKPLACMTYGDSIVGGAREEGQTRAGLGVRRVSSPSMGDGGNAREEWPRHLASDPFPRP
jgi:hypothetical protein